MLGLKRSMREDSASEAASPLPNKRRYNGNGRVESPDRDVKMELQDEPQVGGRMWHCKNCGVPENLSGGIKRDSKGDLSLCDQCGELAILSSPASELWTDDVRSSVLRQETPTTSVSIH